jgi:ribonuclease BN (tRNA processing enzyme)
MTAPLTLTFLGSGDAFGSGGRFQTCILLEAAGSRSLIDCGASSLVSMKKLGIDPGSIDHVLVTHLHGDHFGGLPFLILDAQFAGRERQLDVIGPPGIEERVRQAMEVFFPKSSQTRQRFALGYQEFVHGIEAEIAPGLTVTPFEVRHFCGAPPYAIRIECAGRTVAYSGDTEWTDALLDASRDADLFICEAYFYEKTVKFHLDYATLEAQKHRFTCRRLILTHMSQDMLSRSAVAAELAHDGMVVRV